ncbi:tumor protein p53-inducible nuclear protein 2 [Amia ocellicauda]|uniref:tumor protein p53-inducible nuclear protein 2 n=1 Tax=Amia ocellicauda TaxID=2972642 RepID=UPI0034640F31
MFGKIANLFLGNRNDNPNDKCDVSEEFFEFEEGGWVIVTFQEKDPLEQPEINPLENLLIEHPSMSVYNLRDWGSDEEDLNSEEEDEDSSRLVQVGRFIPWRLSMWEVSVEKDSPLHCIRRARQHSEHRKLSRGHLCRQNRCKKRYSPREKHYGCFKQPCQRIYNY